jgi:hypothetical protein
MSSFDAGIGGGNPLFQASFEANFGDIQGVAPAEAGNDPFGGVTPFSADFAQGSVPSSTTQNSSDDTFGDFGSFNSVAPPPTQPDS